MRTTQELSFRPKQADAFFLRSLPANASACKVEKSLFVFAPNVDSRQVVRRTNRKES